MSEYSPTEKQNGVVGLGNVLRTVGSLRLMCDPRDLGVALGSENSSGSKLFEPTLYLYDNYPGGIGQSEPLFRLRETLLAKSRELLSSCPCEKGCPSCVGPIGEVGEKSKEVAKQLVEGLATFRRKKEKLRGGWVQSANFASECARKLLIL